MKLKKSEVDAQLEEMEIHLFGHTLKDMMPGIRICALLSAAYQADYPREKALLVLASNQLLVKHGYYYTEE
jgi:hypothetical protein